VSRCGMQLCVEIQVVAKRRRDLAADLILSREAARHQRRALHPYTHTSFPSIMYALAWQSKQLMDLEYLLI
jgi:hypothetical protein